MSHNAKPTGLYQQAADFLFTHNQEETHMARTDTYIGIQNEIQGGMTNIGKIIRDAWVFELIPETETCEGWNLTGIDALLQKVNTEWDKYGCSVSQLPKELFERHQKIHRAGLEKAKAEGWSGEDETDDDS